MTIINTRIKELRARYNLTQDELADKVGVTRQTMLYLEKGKYNPSLVLAYKVAKALNSTIEEVLSSRSSRIFLKSYLLFQGFFLQCFGNIFGNHTANASPPKLTTSFNVFAVTN